MASIRDITEKLFPTGRAHKVGDVGSNMRLALSDGVERVNDSIDNLIDGVLPDNPNFTIDWCLRHEKMYGLSVYPGDTLQTRVARILSHITPYPQDVGVLSLQSLQDEIDNAGWAGVLYIHENLSGLYPHEVLPQLSYPVQSGDGQLADFQLGGHDYANDYSQFYQWFQLADFQLGGGMLGNIPQFNNKIANSLSRFDDLFVNLSPIENTFYVCGQNLGDIVVLPQSDEIPLRQLLLDIKPLNSVGFLLIEYI